MTPFEKTQTGIALALSFVLAAACSNDSNGGEHDAGTGGAATGGGGTTNGGGGGGGAPTSTGGLSSGGVVGSGGNTTTGGSGGAAGAGGASGGAGGATGGTAGAGGNNDGGGPDAGAPTNCAPPLDIDAPIQKLSATGCMDPADPKKLAPYVLPYEVNSPLWSDSADKSRGMRLPDGAKIHVKDCVKEPSLCTQGTADDGKWVLPVGTVMVKNFLFDGKLVETRLFERFDATTWVGYSYAWDEAQTDATVLPDARKEVMFDTGSRKADWNYPSRVDCMKCHNPQNGFTIGPETAQMNRTVGGKNQIDTWSALGLFDAAPAKPYKAALVLPYPGQLGTVPAGATVEQRTRSYLHANCAFCHRPDGDFTALDMRFGTAFKDMGLCNAAPMKGDVGVNGALNVKPGDPMHSVVWLRMDALPNEGRMPQIATYQIDDQGVKLVGDWITALNGCP